jgi:hypothetical protein
MADRDDHPTDSDLDTTVVELGTGFDGDDVAVLLNGREVWHRDGVSTNYSVGLADVVRLASPAGDEGLLEVRVGRRTASQQVDLQAGAGAGRWRVDIDPSGALALGPAPDGPVF